MAAVFEVESVTRVALNTPLGLDTIMECEEPEVINETSTPIDTPRVSVSIVMVSAPATPVAAPTPLAACDAELTPEEAEALCDAAEAADAAAEAEMSDYQNNATRNVFEQNQLNNNL